MLVRAVAKLWIPLVLAVVFAVAGLVVLRLHRQFASADLNADAGAGIEIRWLGPAPLALMDSFRGRASANTRSFSDQGNSKHQPAGAQGNRKAEDGVNKAFHRFSPLS